MAELRAPSRIVQEIERPRPYTMSTGMITSTSCSMSWLHSRGISAWIRIGSLASASRTRRSRRYPSFDYTGLVYLNTHGDVRLSCTHARSRYHASAMAGPPIHCALERHDIHSRTCRRDVSNFACTVEHTPENVTLASAQCRTRASPLLLRNLQDYTGGEFVFADKSGQQTTTVQPAAGRV